MDNIINVLSFVKDTIILVINELEILNKIKDIGIKKLPLYIETINTLQCSIINLERVFEKDIPIQHKLKRLVILALKLDLDEFRASLQECKLWHDKILTQNEEIYMKRLNNCTYSCININLCSVELLTTIPTEVLKKLEDTFQIINEKIQDVIKLEQTIFGTALSIKHPLLQKVWMNCGLNQLNDTEIPANLMVELLYNMWLQEEGGILHNKERCIQMLTDFVNIIDNLSGTKANGKISVQELNQVPITDKNKKSIKGLLGIPHQPIYKNQNELDNNDISKDFSEKNLSNEIHVRFKESSLFLQDKEKYSELIIKFVDDLNKIKNNDKKEISQINVDENNINNNSIDTILDSKLDIKLDTKLETIIQEDIPLNISLASTININHTYAVNIPECDGYGANWPSILVSEFIIPEFNIINENVFSGIQLLINATDQGWGGTGHDNVRYQINDDKIVVGFFIDRIKNKNNLYTLNISPSQIKSNDKIKIWLSCAPWGGWKATMTSIKGKLTFN
jgi:hypothetical protein